MNTEFAVMCEISFMMKNPSKFNADEIHEYIEKNKDTIKMENIYKLIMILMRNEFPYEVLINLAALYSDTFVVDFNDIFENRSQMKSAIYFANILCAAGIPKESFVNFDQNQITGEEYKRKKHPEIVQSISDGDLAKFVLLSQNMYNREVKGLSLISWAALFKKPDIFEFLLSKGVPLYGKTTGIGIKKGNERIIEKIIEKSKISNNIIAKELVRYHRNKALINISKSLDIKDDTIENLKKIATENLNYEAYLMLMERKNNNN